MEQDVDLSHLENFIVEAIETDTVKEYTVPLNDDAQFINSHYFEEHIKKAEIKVSVVDHIIGEEGNICDLWVVELKAGDEQYSKEISLGETASFLVEQKDIPESDEGVDPIEMPGYGFIELSIIADSEDHALTSIKLEVS